MARLARDRTEEQHERCDANANPLRRWAWAQAAVGEALSVEPGAGDQRCSGGPGAPPAAADTGPWTHTWRRPHWATLAR